MKDVGQAVRSVHDCGNAGDTKTLKSCIVRCKPCEEYMVVAMLLSC